MEDKLLALKLKEHLLNTVGKKPSKEEMEKIKKQLQEVFKIIYDKPDKEESLIAKTYNEKLSVVWKKVIANETLLSELILFKKYAQVKPKYNIASFASGLGVYELFLAKEFVPQGVVSCIDISEGMNKIGKGFAKKLNQRNIEFITSSIVKTTLESNSQDIVLARRTGLSKDKKWVDILKEAYRILRKQSASTFIYTVDKVFNDPVETIKSNLERANFSLVALEESHTSTSGTVCMIIAKPNAQP